MELIPIIFLLLVIVWIILDIFRDSNRKKWYMRGYSDAYIKYDKSDSPPIKSHQEEGQEMFNDHYGFKYD